MLTQAELEWFKSQFLPALADEVVTRLSNKLDAINTKLDKFVGDIENKREAQELHQNTHDQTDRRIGRVEKQLHLPPLD